jgi:hypothetical protein
MTTRVIGPLPMEFVEFLHDDGILLETYVDSKLSNVSDEKTGFSDSEDDETNVVPTFPDVEQDLKRCIAELGGKVFPKLNWSAPRDAAWIAMNASLQCTCPNDVLLLLKASDFVAHDLTNPYQLFNDDSLPKEIYIVLRKWTELEPSMEFRVVVRHGKIWAITPRDENYYPFLQNMTKDIEQSIQIFHSKLDFGWPDYVLDVYLDQKMRPTLIDFNPYGTQTDLIMLDWDEVFTSTEPLTPLMRIIDSAEQANSQMAPRFSTNRVPLDVVALSQGKNVEEFGQAWQEELEKLT